MITATVIIIATVVTFTAGFIAGAVIAGGAAEDRLRLDLLAELEGGDREV